MSSVELQRLVADGDPSAQQAERGPGGGRVRYVLGALGCGAWIVAYSDRTNISLAIIAMDADLGFDSEVDGLVFGAFFCGYFCTQVLGGWAAARWGGKKVLAFAVFMWSLWTLFTPMAAYVSVPALVVCRVALGLGEGVALPALHHVTAQWAAKHERSRFVAAVTSGQHIGKALALVCSPLVAIYWPAIFYIFAGLGVLWLGAWGRWAADTPASHPTISEAERRYIQDGAEPPSVPRVVPWRRICREPAVWAPVLCHTGHNWANYFALMWLPKYLNEQVGVPLAQTGFVLLLPYAAPVLGGNIGAQLADRLLQRGWSVLAVRRCMECISCGSSMLCLGYFAVVETPSLTAFTVLTTIEGFFATFSFSGYLTNIIDIGPAFAGPLMGISNTVATIPGIVANVLAGGILATYGDWRPVFGLAVGVLGLGLVIFLTMAKGTVVLVPEGEDAAGGEEEAKQ